VTIETNGQADFYTQLAGMMPSGATTFAPDEYVNRLTGHSQGNSIVELTVYTNLSNTYSSGDSTQADNVFELDLQGKWALVNFFGKRDNGSFGYSKIGFWVRPVAPWDQCEDFE
jgi:hypothetical protein